MANAQDFNQRTFDKAAHAAALAVASAPSGSIAVQDYTAQLTDIGPTIRGFTLNAPITFRVPSNAEMPCPINSEIPFAQLGTGIVTVTPKANVTILARAGVVTTAGQYAVAMLKKTDVDTWLLTGDVA